MHGDVVLADVWWVLVASLAVVAVFAPLTMRLYRQER
jgi:ABC-2 type transport system permease protein